MFFLCLLDSRSCFLDWALLSELCRMPLSADLDEGMKQQPQRRHPFPPSFFRAFNTCFSWFINGDKPIISNLQPRVACLGWLPPLAFVSFWRLLRMFTNRGFDTGALTHSHTAIDRMCFLYEAGLRRPGAKEQDAQLTEQEVIVFFEMFWAFRPNSFQL